MPNRRYNNRSKRTSERKKRKIEKVDKKDKKRNKKKKKHPKLMIFIKILIILVLLLCVIGAGIVAAMLFGLFGDEFEITKEELTVGDSNTIILDKDGNEIANLSSDEIRKTISISEMSEYLPKAYIAIEDKRFYSHSGVDLKRTVGAIIGKLTGKSSYGGSSITQQLVKNVTNDKERTGIEGVTRKIKEWAKAIQVERMISKDQVLELYLNIIYVGGNNIHGVELGAQYYFSKSAKDLDLAECAFLAGINSAPMSYDPYDESKDQEKLAETRKNKTLTVLSEMKDQGLVEDEETYNVAVEKVNAGLAFTKGNTDTNARYSYHTAAAIETIISQLMEEKDMSREMARTYLYGSGLTVYSTEDASIQSTVEEEFAKTKYQVSGRLKNADGSLKNNHTQAAIVILDHTTGKVTAIGGGLGENNAIGLNRGTQAKRQTGSSMKIIADIAPGLQEKIITAATIYDDVITEFGGNYHPGDHNTPKGLINIRSCIRTSQNVPMVKIMRELTAKKAIEYLEKSGITTLNERDNNLAISIGGVDQGISPLEMAGAYGTIANDGVYITPIFYTKIVDKNGNVILTPKQEKTRVYSEQVAYITRTIAEEPTKSGGTASFCGISGMETCAKTGSTDSYVDRWLCGMTPYYTAACWWGFDKSQEPLTYSNGIVYSVDGRNPAGQLWSEIMKKIHTNLPNKNFSKPSSGLTQATICSITGCVATSTCTNTYTEIFTTDNVPSTCEGHGTQTLCKETGKIANEYCPETETVNYGGVIPKEKLGLWHAVGGVSKTGNEEVTEKCDVHKKPEEKPAKNNVISNEIVNGTNTVNNTTSSVTNTTTNTTVNNNTANSAAVNNTTNSIANNTIENNNNNTTNTSEE